MADAAGGQEKGRLTRNGQEVEAVQKRQCPLQQASADAADTINSIDNISV